MYVALDTDSLMTLLLIRFALLVAGAAVLVLVVFTVLVVLKKRGRLDDARKYGDYVAPAARAYLDSRRDYRYGSRRGGILSTILRAVLNSLDDRGRRR
ncbi:hypothetical protein [Actinoplanes regularis]|uniref:Uncharacterized protein n=1 Tax=Actinoplanes regularis TaxID=52697 RepID=A0A239F0D2_9ACTN|nr:hypothetical protein [Actinoplanes regularis]GIE89905.1 hypothetical protein Are01nite_63850 [Actinoplanes regularis]GLW33537.1 hypothetical protein Areg01_64750 [Actinoplanes regularis]SNS50349.1 hypothetical protein SAMN06264365_11716 [Actinoplanes regularis]